MFSASARQPGGIAAATVRVKRSRSFRTKKSQTGMTTSPSRKVAARTTALIVGREQAGDESMR